MNYIQKKLKSNMSILLIIKEPFLDRIPSLKTLIWYFMEKMGYDVTVLMSSSNRFPGISFTHKKMNVISIKERTRKIEFPTTLKLMMKAYAHMCSKKYDFIIGGDAYGNIIAANLARIKKIPHIFFMMEYPEIPAKNKIQSLENKSLENADYIIVHDKWHFNFIENKLRLRTKNVFNLPNASFTPKYEEQSDFLRKRLGIGKDKTLVLHSGGFMNVFRCEQLALSTKDWGADVKLAFHVSHPMTGNEYYERIKSHNLLNVVFSDKPVSTFELDELVASADIGIALYDESILGYRATYMGLAAGKIGNYLKCGVPVIATRLPSLSYLEEYGCGILIEDESEIKKAIKVITENKEAFRKNAFKCYDELWYPESYLNQLIANLVCE